MQKRDSFAAFIMTYERPDILAETISIIKAQHVAPVRILIVDNSESHTTEAMIRSIADPEIEYVRMGYNSGPAGAAEFGLKRLTSQGFKWIFWGDDDDPPKFSDSFAVLFSIIDDFPNANFGIVGAVGQHFNGFTGSIERVNDNELLKGRFIEVSSIAGGQTMLVNSDVVTHGALPDPDLYFGFEELDFCLKVKKAGFKLAASSELFLRSRKKYGRMGLRPPFYIGNTSKNWKRQYYSSRNILLLLKNQSAYIPFFFQLAKSVGKCFYGFRFGFAYGKENLKMISMGVVHVFSGKKGKVL